MYRSIQRGSRVGGSLHLEERNPTPSGRVGQHPRATYRTIVP